MRDSAPSAASSPRGVTRVAVIGLGTMGLPMARHLVATGYEVVGCDVDPARVALLGAGTAATPAAAAKRAEVVLLSLPTPAVVEDVALGVDGVRDGAGGGTLLVDMSTSPPALARRLASECAELDVLDAPVSGGPRGAEEATLTIMVGGDEPAFRRALPLFESLGSLVVLVGTHGAGQAAKLCNNLIAGATMAAIAESCAIARREGIDPRVLYELVSASTGDSRVLRTRFPLAGADEAHPSSNGFAPLFALDLIAKDMGLALELAEAHGVEPTVARAALAAYREAQRDGRGALDYSAVYLRFDPDEAGE
jgi:3-hydroxyisobutyrate dehydrogenase